jgi:hypothetical protein
LGKNQGGKEGVVRYFEISGATALRIAAWSLIRTSKCLGCHASPSPNHHPGSVFLAGQGE